MARTVRPTTISTTRTCAACVVSGPSAEPSDSLRPATHVSFPTRSPHRDDQPDGTANPVRRHPRDEYGRRKSTEDQRAEDQGVEGQRAEAQGGEGQGTDRARRAGRAAGAE